jgi:biopolymer transport protein TolR
MPAGPLEGGLPMGVTVNTGKGVAADINVVPLIDILLVLIIIFMVISPVSPKGLHAVVPQPSPYSEANSHTVVVQVSAGGVLKIDQVRTTWESLGSDLDGIFKLRADKVAFVMGDDSADFADVARAIDIMRSHGVERVGLITAKLAAA